MNNIQDTILAVKFILACIDVGVNESIINVKLEQLNLPMNVWIKIHSYPKLKTSSKQIILNKLKSFGVEEDDLIFL